MSIRRAPRPESGFYTLDKRISEDQRLSWAARGLLIFLLGKPDHWEVSVKHLIAQTDGAIGKSSGRDAVRVILKELEEAGYLQVDLARSKGGVFNGMDYTVSEVPITAPQTDIPAPASPETDYPAPAKPAPANPHQVNTDSKQGLILGAKTDSLLPDCDGAPSAMDSAFERFWSAGLVKTGRKAARKAFDTAMKREKRKPEEFGNMLADDVRERIKRGQFGIDRLHPTTYLNGDRWNDAMPKAGSGTSPALTSQTRNFQNTDYGNSRIPSWLEEEIGEKA